MSQAPSVRDSDKSKPYLPRAGLTHDGWSRDNEATATCFCGAVQLAFPTVSPGFVSSVVCNCADCRKITASMFSTLLIIADSHLRHIRGKDNLKTFALNENIASGKLMTNYFCDTCGSLMYRVSEIYPGHSLLRLGTVDDANLAEGRLKPTMEVYVKDRVSWLAGVPGDDVVRFDGSAS